MVLGITKGYFYGFHPISAKLYDDLDYHGAIQAITFLGNRLSFKNVALRNCNMEVNGKILKYAIS